MGQETENDTAVGRNRGLKIWQLASRSFLARERDLHGHILLRGNLRFFDKKSRLKAAPGEERPTDSGPSTSELRRVALDVHRRAESSLAKSVASLAAIGRRALPAARVVRPVARRSVRRSSEYLHSGSAVLGREPKKGIGRHSTMQPAALRARAEAGLRWPTRGVLTSGARIVRHQKPNMPTVVGDRTEHFPRESGDIKATFAHHRAPYESERKRTLPAGWRPDAIGAQRNRLVAIAAGEGNADQGAPSGAASLRWPVEMRRSASKPSLPSKRRFHSYRVMPVSRVVPSGALLASDQPPLDSSWVKAPEPQSSLRVHHASGDETRSIGSGSLGADFGRRRGIGRATDPALRPRWERLGHRIGEGDRRRFAASAARAIASARPSRVRPNEIASGMTRPTRLEQALGGNLRELHDRGRGPRAHHVTQAEAGGSKAPPVAQMVADRKRSPPRVGIARGNQDGSPGVTNSEPNVPLASYPTASFSTPHQAHAYGGGNDRRMRSEDSLDRPLESFEIDRSSLAQLVREEYRIAWRASFLDRAPFGMTA